VHGSEMRTDPPPPERRSRDAVTVGHTELSHRVENIVRQLYLHALPIEGPTPHTSTDDRLIVDRPIGQEAAKPNAAELCQTPRQSGVVGDREIHLE
jgi:hypothetical protein